MYTKDKKTKDGLLRRNSVISGSGKRATWGNVCEYNHIYMIICECEYI